MNNNDSHDDLLELTFAYRHSYGDLRPFFNGLREGRAVGTRCPVCARRWYPPRMLCAVDRVRTEFTPLSGRGEIIALTSGPTNLPLTGGSVTETTWALVRVDDAQNAIIARVLAGVSSPVAGDHVVLACPPNKQAPHPAQHAVFIVVENV